MTEPVCGKCGGTGYIVVERDGLSGAERCSCYTVLRTQLLDSAARIPPNFSEKTLENFRLPDNNPVARDALSRVYRAVKHFVREYPFGPKPGLLLIGNPGTGKTHLAVGALRALLAKGFQGVFVDYQDLITRIQRSWSDMAGEDDRFAFEQAVSADVLLIDDLGARRRLEHVEDLITEIITHRYNNRKSVLVTTNLSEPEVGHQVVIGKTEGGHLRSGKSLAEIVGERSRSRLFEMCEFVTLPSVQDFRISNRHN